MPKVIRNRNDPQHAYSLGGTWIHREDRIFLPSHDRDYPCLNTSMHFCYRDPGAGGGARYSSTLLCTCGAPAVTCDYAAYRRFQSKNIGEAIICLYLLQYAQHADGSHE